MQNQKGKQELMQGEDIKKINASQRKIVMKKETLGESQIREVVKPETNRIINQEVIKEIDKEGSVDIIDSCVARISEKWFIIKRNSNRF